MHTDAPSTQKTLRGGVPIYRLTDEDRRKSAEIRATKREAAKAAKLEALLPKAWKAFEKALSQDDVDARMLDAAKFVWEQEHGKATQRIETQETTSSPWDTMTEQERDQAIRALRAKLALVQKPEAA